MRPVAGEVCTETALQCARDAAGHGLGAQGIELVESESHVLLAEIIFGRGQSGRRGRCGGFASTGEEFALAEAVESSHLVGDCAERRHLHIAIMGDLRHLLIVFAKGFAILAHLIEALSLEQHARVGAGQTDNRERANDGCGDEAVDVVKREGNLAHTPVFIP